MVFLIELYGFYTKYCTGFSLLQLLYFLIFLQIAQKLTSYKSSVLDRFGMELIFLLHQRK